MNTVANFDHKTNQKFSHKKEADKNKGEENEEKKTLIKKVK